MNKLNHNRSLLVSEDFPAFCAGFSLFKQFRSLVFYFRDKA